MKRFLLPLLLICLAAVSCEKTPSISVSPSTVNLPTEGGTVNVNISATGAWTVINYDAAGGVTVSPLSGSGDSPVSITVPANESGISGLTTYVTFSCNEGGNYATVTITQEFSEEDIDMNVEGVQKKWDYTGGTMEVTVDCNYAWTGTIESPMTMSPTSGEAGKTKTIITIPENASGNSLECILRIEASSITEKLGLEWTIVQDAPYLTYGDDTYKIVKLKDGNIWMAENLRYVPDGFTPSSDLKNVTAGVYYPVKLNDAHTAVEFSTDKAVIESNGYLYQSEVALGLKVGDLTNEDQAKALEGARGICPEGWHIPTATEIVNLVGKAVGYDTKTDAPYYDADKGNGTIEKLNADGFNAKAWGAVSIIDNTKTSGTLMGYLKTCPDIIGSGYVCGSTYVGKTEKGGAITNIQFLGFMPMAGNGTFNGSKLSYRIGASVRCVKDVEKSE